MADTMKKVLVIDAANVIGATPNGWWNDRPGAARKLYEQLLVADVPGDRVVLVLEGHAKAGVPAGRDAHLQTVHAPKDGDRAIVKEVETYRARDLDVIVVTADRALGARVAGHGAKVLSPTWLLDRL